MERKDALRAAGAAITQKPVRITVTIPPSGKLHALAQFIGLMPKSQTFQVRPITLGNMIRISSLLVAIDDDIANTIKKGFDSVTKYGDKIVEAVSIGLHNQKSEPPDYLKSFVANNLTAPELADVLAVILKQLHIQDFINSIVLIKGLNVLDLTSRIQQGSQIAPGESSEPQ